jgi:2-amino-4-hydroxy-6-hydroxymethyldihydropteridine diphosphokinase
MATATVTAYIALGANLGDALANVRGAIRDLDRIRRTRVTAQSSLFRTAPVDAGGDDYVNAVVRVDTALPADELLNELQALESGAGRERSYRNAPRTLDLDLLLYGDLQIDTERLQLPHPRMTERAFVLIPLLQIDPMITIPAKGPAHAFAPQVAGQAIERIAE